jgi:AcrR family transcriptional regulator
MRDRFRAQVRDEIKRVALLQLAESGPQGLSINAIAKELGVSGPALYRYFAGRDELLTELIVDAYDDLADALAAAVEDGSDRAARGRAAQSRAAQGRAAAGPAAPDDAAVGRVRALARAYRAWALEQPHRYRLLFAPPLPGYDAHSGPLVDAADRSMTTLVRVVRELPDADRAADPPKRLSRQLAAWSRRRGVEADPAAGLRAVALWARLHGLVSLEISGNFESMGLDGGQLFESELDALV